MFIRHGRQGSRATALRVGLYFLAAGVWLGGVAVENDLVTAFGMAIAVGGLMFSLVMRRRSDAEDRSEESG